MQLCVVEEGPAGLVPIYRHVRVEPTVIIIEEDIAVKTTEKNMEKISPMHGMIGRSPL